MVVSDHPRPQPPPEISHRDCAGVNCTQKSRQRGAQQLGTLRAQKIYEELRQFVWIYLRRKQDTHVIPEVYWSIVHFLLGNALGDQISDAWFPPFLVSDGESIN